MNRKDLTKYDLPDEPGVYTFRNSKRQRIYIGKATSLKSRVASYFGAGLMGSRGPLLVKMLEEAKSLEYEQTDSVLEALILEANLIKRYQPIYNSKEKSDKSFNYLVITDEEYPRLLIKRGRELVSEKSSKDTSDISLVLYSHIFGPFPQGTALKEALKVVRKIFPYRDKCSPCEALKKRAVPCEALAKQGKIKGCFSYQIGLCPGVCAGHMRSKEYKKIVRNIILLFKGKKKRLVEQLGVQMRKDAKAERFEEAAKLRNQIYALEHINDVAIMGGGNSTKSGNTQRRIEAYDVAHMSEQNRVGVMVVLESGEPAKGEYKKFKIKTDEQGDIAGLKELLTRRLKHNESDGWSLPSLIVVDGGKAQVNATRKVLQHAQLAIPVVGVVKNEKHKPKAILGDKAIGTMHESEILLANSESHRFAINYHKKIRNKNLFY